MVDARAGGHDNRMRVVVDSSSNVPPDLLSQLGIIEVPAIVNFGDESYRNQVDLSTEAFYSRFAASAQPPTTSQPPPALFAKAYRQAFDEGAEHLLVVTVSSRLSGTFGSAQMAMLDFEPDRFTLWDSYSASIGSGWQAIEGAQMMADGADLDAVFARMERVRSQILGYFTVESLKYLARSGRVSNLQAGLGDLLSVKPILRLRNHLLEPVVRVRGRNRSLRELVERTVEHVGNRPAHLAVGHANAPAVAETLASHLQQSVQIRKMLIVEVGPALASLAGPGCVGVASYPC